MLIKLTYSLTDAAIEIDMKWLKYKIILEKPNI